MPTRYDPHHFAVNLPWLLRLRWFAAAGQLATVAFAAGRLRVALPLSGLLALIAITACSNLALEFWRRAAGAPHGAPALAGGRYLIAAIMTIDLASLTGLLYLTGGIANPFVVFYFVNLALGGVVLTSSWSWTLCGLSVVCMGALSAYRLPLPILESPSADGLALRRRTTLIALTACSAVVTYFITRVTRALQVREHELRVAERQRERSERLEALATLAAGAGHELASPLSTIAVVAKELTNHLEGADVPATVLEDVALIRSELDHCRSILNRMSGQAGQAAGEAVLPIAVEALINEALLGLRGAEVGRVELRIPADIRLRTLRVPLQGLALAIRGVLQNALDAGPGAIRVSADLAAPQTLQLRIVDRGCGMSDDVMRRAGEPFFTTKEPGKGMGLGLFLTRSVIDRLGGAVSLQSTAEQGTTAVLEIPLEDSAPP